MPLPDDQIDGGGIEHRRRSPTASRQQNQNDKTTAASQKAKRWGARVGILVLTV